MSELMDRLRLLHRIDQKLIRLKKRLVAAREETGLLEKQLAGAAEVQKKAEEAIRRQAVEMDRFQLDARTAEAELADQDRKLKIVKNNVEYAIVTDRIRELRRRIDESETTLLQSMDSMDRQKAELLASQGAVADLQRRQKELVEGNEADAASIRSEQQDLAQRRKLAVEEIRSTDEHAYSLYDDALRRNHGDALAELKDGVCQACFMRQNAAVINATLVGRDLRTARCGGCGRILRAPAGAAEDGSA